MTADGSIRFEGHGAVIECSMVPWDTEIFGFPVRRSRASNSTSARTRRTTSKPSTPGVSITTSRLRLVPARSPAAAGIDGPGVAGFRFVETVYRPRFDGSAAVGRRRRRRPRGRASPATRTVGRSRPRRSRQALPRWITALPPDLSDAATRLDTRSRRVGRRRLVLKAELDGDLAGFFIVERRPERSVYWHSSRSPPRWREGRGHEPLADHAARHGADGRGVRRDADLRPQPGISTCTRGSVSRSGAPR